MHIKIVRRPNGEAPDWVRDAWIGLSLPTFQKSEQLFRGVGVLTGPANAFLQVWEVFLGRAIRVSGYAVSAKMAVDILAETRPAAAEWWRTNTPKLVVGKRCFVFDADACEHLGD